MSSVQTLFMIGGFIILFSVFSQMLAVVHVTDLLSIGIGSILKTMHLPPELDLAMIAGLFEITLEVSSQDHKRFPCSLKQLWSALF